MTLKHLDLFSGIGGFALAARWAGMETIGFSEIDPYASRILKRHWPDVPNHGDIHGLRGVRADIVTGGFPCQPFSCVGQRTGKADNRYLWPEMRRVISESDAAWVLGENVPELDGVALDDVLADLENIGYETATFEIPACGVGAAHRRRRLWIVAHATRNGMEKPEGQDWQSLAGSCAPCGLDAIGEAGWPAEPRVGRVAHGIPDRVDRIKGLGNAIVPAIAYRFLKTIANLEAHAERANVKDLPRRTEDSR